MRLIDADALKQEWAYIDGIPAVTEHDIDNAPTIAAIPVEWLTKFQSNMPNTAALMGVDVVLKMWEQQKDGEQEAIN